MAKLTITNVTKANDWYPVFKTVIVFAKDETPTKQLDFDIFEKAKTLKNGTRKYSNSGMAMKSGVTVADVIKFQTRLLEHVGFNVTVE